MRPEVIAGISNFVAYANANAKAETLVDEAVRNDPGIYPSAEVRAKLITLKTPSDKEVRNISRAWTRVKTGQ